MKLHTEDAPGCSAGSIVSVGEIARGVLGELPHGGRVGEQTVDPTLRRSGVVECGVAAAAGHRVCRTPRHGDDAVGAIARGDPDLRADRIAIGDSGQMQQSCRSERTVRCCLETAGEGIVLVIALCRVITTQRFVSYNRGREVRIYTRSDLAALINYATRYFNSLLTVR